MSPELQASASAPGQTWQALQAELTAITVSRQFRPPHRSGMRLAAGFAAVVVCVWLGIAAGSPVLYDAVALELATTVLSDAQQPTRSQATALKLANLQAAWTLLDSARGANGLSGDSLLVVLPEYGLTGPDFPTRDSVLPFGERVPAPWLAEVPCGNSTLATLSPAVENASCTARTTGADIVVDVPEVEPCLPSDTSCPPDGRRQFNTLVALRGSDGAVVGRYRKRNLYYEPAFDPGTASGGAPWFDSSFGVRIGLMICFDIMFRQPSADILSAGVRDVAYSTWWVNVPPFLTGTQVQAGWANASGANVVAAGAGHNGWRSAGSGVYAMAEGSEGRMKTTFKPNSSSPQEAAVALAGLVGRRLEAERRVDRRGGRAIAGAAAGAQAQRRGARWLINETKFVPGAPQRVSAAVDGVDCELELEAGPTANQVYAVVAAQGWYNGLFPTVMCGVCACANGSLPCFEGQGTLAATGQLKAAELRMTVCNSTRDPLSTWRVYANAADGDAQTLNPQGGFAASGLARSPAGAECAEERLSLVVGVPVLDAMLYGVSFAVPG